MGRPERTVEPELEARVHSLDVDRESVACTRELKRRFFPEDPERTVERASVLDDDFMEALENGAIPVAAGWLLWVSPSTTTRGSRAGCGKR